MIILLNRSIWLIDGNLTGITNQGRPGCNENKEVFNTLQMVYWQETSFEGGVLILCRGYSHWQGNVLIGTFNGDIVKSTLK